MTGAQNGFHPPQSVPSRHNSPPSFAAIHLAGRPIGLG
jgi:hypothetical protein